MNRLLSLRVLLLGMVLGFGALSGCGESVPETGETAPMDLQKSLDESNQASGENASNPNPK